MLASAPADHPLSTEERAVVRAVVDQAPPISQSARARLSALLRPAGTDFTDALRATIQGGAAR